MEVLFRKSILVCSAWPKDLHIASLHWKYLQNKEYYEPCRNLESISFTSKQRGNFYELQLTAPTESLDIKMMAVKKILVNDGGNIEHQKEESKSVNPLGIAWRSFTCQEIMDFVNRIGDENPIHRTVHPIVPGCLLLEKLFETVTKQTEVTRFQEISARKNRILNSLFLRFRSAALGEEQLYLDVKEDKITIRTDQHIVATGYLAWVVLY